MTKNRLPIVGVALTVLGATLVLPTDPAKAQSEAAASPVAAAAAQSSILGAWEFANANDGKRVKDTFVSDGTFLENGQLAGTWKSNGSQLMVTYKSHPEWLDTYNLPPRDGLLRGTNRQRHQLTLARAGATPPASAGTGGGATVATIPATTTTGGAPDATYFGKKEAGTIPDGRALTTPLTPIATPPPLATTQAGNFAGNKPAAAAVTSSAPGAAAAAVPTPTPPVASTPARTPVGKWHWHAGADKQLTEKGAILEESRVVGQWRWTEQSQGKIQVQWTGGARRAPMNYTLSEHGNHLVGKSPESGNEHSEDRIE